LVWHMIGYILQWKRWYAC